jgi:ATP-dependent Clp protease ATP-binding subunit ClpA
MPSLPFDIWCERCYAKAVFSSEYPNLTQQSLAHIKSLPRVMEFGQQFAVGLNVQNTPRANPISRTPANPFVRLPYNPLTGTPANPISRTPAIPTTTPTIPFTDELKASLQKLENQKQAMIAEITSNKLHVPIPPPSFIQLPGIVDNPDVNCCQDGSQSATNNRKESAKRLNDFIKKTLFPDLMEFPDLEPQTKNQKLDLLSTEDEEEDDRSDWPFEWIGGDVKSIKDLIRIGREYKTNPKRVQTNLDMEKLVRLVEPLETLQDMVGLEDIKDSIFKQVVFHLQDLDNGNKDMHHTVIKGPPGVGKTQISHIIARIYKGLGFLKKDTVVSVKRDDLIAGYLGQTALKAKKKYEEALGGVLLIDEAYALGDGSDKDSYSKEAIDLLTSYLSEHGHEFICIIAGYKEALEKRFFSVNEGLARRFNIHYEIKPYSGSDICQIFQKLVSDGGWQIDASAYNPEFFTRNLESFPHFGGDMLNLFAYTKKAHSSRLLAIRTKEQLMNTKKKINMADLEAGFEQYKTRNGYASKDSTPFEAKFMYM